MKKWFTAETKFWKVMKICGVQSAMAMMIVGVSMAYDGSSQMLEKKVTISLDNVPLETALKQIAAEASVKFVYSADQFNEIEQVSISVDQQPLGELLDAILTPRHIKYKVHEKEMSITLRFQPDRYVVSDNLREVERARLMLVTGKVTGGVPPEPLAGVNVIIKGTTIGTTTDVEGKFSIQGSDKDILIFSFIGFISFETQIGSRTQIDVTLEEDTKKLNEVIVNAGYWEVDSKEQTGNISRITAKQIETQPVISPMQAMQGRMPGVQISQVSGTAGDGFTIQIRGLNSIRSGTANDPLYIVDGVPFSSATLFVTGGNVVRGPSPLSSINPSDIESIEVLKDADATAIYGSRGANGVVLITTKKGKSGKTQADINVYTGLATMGRQLEMLNTSQYVAMRKEAFKNDGVTPTNANAPDLLLWDTTRYTDWKKELFGGTAPMTSVQASISGGNSTTQFLVGGGFLKQSTVFSGDFGYKKGSGHLNLSHTSADNKFAMNLSGSFVSEVNLQPQNDLVIASVALAPDAPAIYNPDGSLNWENGTWNNPIGEIRKVYKSSTKNLVSNLNLSYQIVPGFRVKANGGLNYITTSEISITPIASFNPAVNPTGSTISSKGSISTWILEPQADYQRTIGRGKVNVLVGTTFQQSLRERQGFIASGYINDTQLENLAAAATITPYQLENTEYKYNAVFGRINYTWDEKYILNVTGRRDGSSRFGPDKRFANFGAVGAAWIFSRAGFIKNVIPGLSFGKLRASYGLTGSDQIGDYQYLATYSSTANSYQGGKGLIPSRLLNPGYSWEVNRKSEIGLEFSLLQEKLYLSGSYYHSRSSNQLVGYSLPAITGFTSVQSNLPAEIQNSGLELVVSNVNIKRGSFTWTSSLNLTFPKNRLVSYPNIEGSSYANTYAVDRSLYVQKKYKSLGVNPQTGLYVFEDVDNSGTLSSTLDTQFIKERATDYFGGFQNSFSYKGFELQFLFQFVKQTGFNYIYSIGTAPGARSNQPIDVLGRWRQPGDEASIQRFTQTGPGTTAYSNASSLGDGGLSDASYIRLQNLSFSWTMPASLSGKIKSEKIRLYMQGQNLFIITGFNGADPETQNARTLSPLRIVTFGAQLTF